MSGRAFRGMIAACVIGMPAVPAMAIEPEENDFVFVSDLLARGFTPFGTSGTSEEMFGMTDGAEIYICHSVDSRKARSPRQDTLDAEMANESPDRSVPNIAIACVLTQ